MFAALLIYFAINLIMAFDVNSKSLGPTRYRMILFSKISILGCCYYIHDWLTKNDK